MNSFTTLTALFLLTLGRLAIAAPKQLPCPLQWVPISAGETHTHSLTTSPFNHAHYIVRARLEADTPSRYVGGRMSLDESGVALLIDTSSTPPTIIQLTRYEILTNPHGCRVRWETEMSQFAVPISNSAPDAFIGRTSIQLSGAYTVISGLVHASTFYYIGNGPPYISESTPSFEYLTSFSAGLTSTLAQFQFENDANPVDIEFMGMDEIHNRSPAVVHQSLTHRTRHTRMVSMTSERGWGYAWSLSISFKIPFTIMLGPIPVDVEIAVDLAYSFEEENSESTTVTQVEEKEILIERNITVAPYTSVEACTLLIKKEEMVLGYTSSNTYSAPGLSGEQVQAELLEDGITDGVIEGDTVRIETRGEIRASLAVMTRFVVTEATGDVAATCTGVGAAFAKIKEQEAGGMVTRHEAGQARLKLLDGMRIKI